MIKKSTFPQMFTVHDFPFISNLKQPGCASKRDVLLLTTLQCTDVRFASLLSGGFITAIVVNPPERKLAKRTSVQCMEIFSFVQNVFGSFRSTAPLGSANSSSTMHLCQQYCRKCRARFQRQKLRPSNFLPSSRLAIVRV